MQSNQSHRKIEPIPEQEPKDSSSEGVYKTAVPRSVLEPIWGRFYRISGILLMLAGFGGVVVSRMGSILYASGYPNSPTAYLELISKNQALANTLWSLWIFLDFLVIAPTVALYLILRHSNRTLALLGSLLSALYIVYDISVTELNSLTLVSLSQGYASASTDALRASYVAAATYGYAALPLQTVLSFGIGSVGYLLWSVPMMKSMFRRSTAIFGMIVSVIGILGSAAPVVPSSYVLGLLQFICVPASGLWFIFVGFQLFRHSKQLAYLDSPTLGQTATIGK